MPVFTGLQDVPAHPTLNVHPPPLPQLPPSTGSSVGIQQGGPTLSNPAVLAGAFAPVVGTTSLSALSDGVGYDRRMLLSKRYFSGPVPPVGKDEDIQYEMNESEKVEIPLPAHLWVLCR